MPALTRRRVLLDGGRGLMLLGLLGASVTACGSDIPDGPDPLEQQLELARHDSDLATAAAKAVPPALARALTEVAAERSRHATALIEEIARAARKPTPTSSESASPTTTSAAAGATAERRRRRRHAAQLRGERHQAGTDPVGLSRRSAGVHRSVLHDAVLSGAAVEGPAPVTSPTPTPDRPAEADKAALVRRRRHRARRDLRVRDCVGAQLAGRERPGFPGAGQAPRATRGGDHDAVRALGQGSATRRRLPVAVPRHHPGRRRRSWRLGWRTTARWRGAR